jgi:hypothetical protein
MSVSRLAPATAAFLPCRKLVLRFVDPIFGLSLGDRLPAGEKRGLVRKFTVSHENVAARWTSFREPTA